MIVSAPGGGSAPPQELEDCAQLVKANSIQGAHRSAPLRRSRARPARRWPAFRTPAMDLLLRTRGRFHSRWVPAPAGNKDNNLTIVYTPWANLKKTSGCALCGLSS